MSSRELYEGLQKVVECSVDYGSTARRRVVVSIFAAMRSSDPA